MSTLLRFVFYKIDEKALKRCILLESGLLVIYIYTVQCDAHISFLQLILARSHEVSLSMLDALRERL